MISATHATGPDLDQSKFQDGEIRPSWSRSDLYVDPGHRSIFERTDSIPGWQVPGDSYKIYEVAHYCGDVILEIGTFSGRSAVVAVEGALSNPDRQSTCFFSIDVHPDYARRGHEALTERGLGQHSAFFLGGLGPFIDEFSISPTMVFVDGDHRYAGVKQDLILLARYVQPGVPILCHDYLNSDNGKPEMGVRQAVDEWMQDGFGRYIGSCGCSALLIATDKCQGKAYDKPEETLRKVRARTRLVLQAEAAEAIAVRLEAAAVRVEAAAARVEAAAARMERENPSLFHSFRHWVAINVPFVRGVWRYLKGVPRHPS